MTSSRFAGRLFPALLLLISVTLCQTHMARDTVQFTLREAVALALKYHPFVSAAEANLRSSSAQLTQARAVFFPSVNATASASRTDGAFVFNPSFPPRDQAYNSYSAALQVQQTLVDFGRMVNRASASSDVVNASELDVRATRENVVANISVAYFTYIQVERLVAVSEEAVRLAQEHLRRANAYYSVGKRPQFDVTRAEVDLANANVGFIHARSQRHIARVQFENAMGYHPDFDYAVRDTFEIAPFSLSVDSAQTIAVELRPELRSAKARVSAGRSLVTAAWGQNLPTLSAFGTWTWSNFTFPLFSRWNAGLTLSVPLFQGMAVSAQVDQAEAAVDLAEANMVILREAVQLDVQQSYWALREAEERIVAASKLVVQAEENLRLAQKQYEAGLSTPVEVSDAQASLSNARITNIQALFDYSSSLVRLRKAMGTLEERGGMD